MNMKRLLLPLFSLILCLSTGSSAHAGTVVVTSIADSGAGSLRAAIAAANAGDTIQFDATLNGQTITLTSAQLLIDKNLTITGPGASQLTVKRSTAGGTPNFRIFEITPAHTVTIQGLTINNGIALAASYPGGGGVYNNGSTLTIVDCTITGNSAVAGGGITNNAVTAGSATLTVTNSTISNNSAADGLGGGIYNFARNSSFHAVLTVTNSTISGNSAAMGGGIDNDGISSAGSATLTISNSGVTDNSAEIYGGGIKNDGSFSGDSTVIMSNCTISGNSSLEGGGGLANRVESSGDVGVVSIVNSTISDNSAHDYGGGIKNSRSTLTVTNSTLTGNRTTWVGGGGGGAIYNDGSGTIGTLDLTHSTLSGNSTGWFGGGVYNGGTFRVGNTIFNASIGGNIHGNNVVSLGYNLSSDSGNGHLTATGDQINTNPILSPLQNNGGPTLTHALLIGSPAINRGNPNFTPPPDFDQRGPGFPRLFNARIDIGSFELQLIAPSPTASPTATATATATPTATATATATPVSTPITPTPPPTPSATPSATPSPTPPTRLLNISTRLRVQTGDNALIGGFIVTGNAPKRVLIRAIGPSFANFGIPNPLPDPTLELHGPGGFSTIINNDWRDTQEAEIEATGIAPTHELESAISAMLPPGAYTAIVRGNNGGTGVGLIEAYDLNSAVDAQLANISTRGFVESGDNVMIGGFILGSGNTNARVLIRAIGPSLTPFGVPDALTDPTLELRNNNGALLAENDDWRDTQETEIAATGIPPSDNRESAIVQALPPSAYTAIVRGKDGTIGVGLVEAYRLATP